MNVGFIHGVMNTDNSSIAGETIDYGPCAFMDTYDPGKVFSSIDMMGRYAYANQPGIAQWNMACLAQCLLHLIDADEATAIAKAQAVIDTFTDHYKLPGSAACAPSSGCSKRAARISPWRTTCWSTWQRTGSTSPTHFGD